MVALVSCSLFIPTLMCPVHVSSLPHALWLGMTRGSFAGGSFARKPMSCKSEFHVQDPKQ